jgi:hypothetical protein
VKYCYNIYMGFKQWESFYFYFYFLFFIFYFLFLCLNLIENIYVGKLATLKNFRA